MFSSSTTNGCLPIRSRSVSTSSGSSCSGPVADTAASTRLIESEHPDAAILDVHLGGDETSLVIARELVKRSIPFAFLTGYSHETLPREFEKVPVIMKLAPFDEISSVVALLFEQAAP